MRLNFLRHQELNINRNLYSSSFLSLVNGYSNDIDILSDRVLSLISLLNSLKSSDTRYVGIVLESLSDSLMRYRDYYESLLTYFDKEVERFFNKEKYENDFQTDFEKHSELKDLNEYVYTWDKDKQHGYELFEQINDDKTGFDAYVFEKDKDVVIVFKGSEQFADYWADGKTIPIDKVNPQYEYAQKLYDTVKDSPRYKDSKITLAGYSLGGNTASVLGSIYNVDTVVFNPYHGVQSQIQKTADDTGKTIEIHPEKVVVYRSEKDGYTKRNEKEHVGDVIYELRNQLVVHKLGRYHLLQNTLNPDETQKKTVDIDDRKEKTIFYPKIK